jgi:hypothetical protein
LPERRKKEIEDKRDTLKQLIQTTLELQRERNVPLNEVVAQINQEGEGIHQDLSRERLMRDQSGLESQTAKSRFFDCSDGVLCETKGGVQ